LFACGLGLAAVAWADDLATLLLLLSLAGAAGASVNAASGRAVMAWFGPQERGLALGVRQGAIPIGGVLAALALPAIERAGGVDAAFVAIGGFTCFGAIVGALVIRDRPHEHIDAHDAPWTLRDGRIWRLSGAGGLYVVAQMALIGFVVLYLHDERGWSNGEAALVLAVIQVIALPARIVAGAWSDRTGRRVAPLRHIGVATFATTALVAVVLDAPAVLLVGAFVVAGVLSMAWNGLSYTAAIELAGRTRAGAAIGFQQTTLSIAGLVAPVAFAAAVSATSWRAAFAVAALCPLVGALMLRPLRV
jgi:sugar phosphate permease